MAKKAKQNNGVQDINLADTFKSLNLLCWNSILEYLVFNLFILDYFGLFSFGFRLRVHLDLSSKSWDQKLLKDLC